VWTSTQAKAGKARLAAVMTKIDFMTFWDITEEIVRRVGKVSDEWSWREKPEVEVSAKIGG